MIRAPSLAAAAGILGVASVALASLLWLMPGPMGVEDARIDDPRVQTTGSLAATPAPASDAEPDAVVAAEPVAPAPRAVPEPVSEPAVAGLLLTRDGDTVILAGTVADPAIRAGVIEAARARFVSQPIVDRLEVEEDAPMLSADVAGVALSALARLAEGEARLEPAGDAGALSIEGRALYTQAAARITEEIGARLPQGWTTRVAIATPEPRPEPIVAALPAQAAPPPAAEATSAESTSETFAQATSADDAADETSPALAYVSDLPRPLPATLAQIDRHPLPPRR